ncbi:MAG: Fic family protein [Deltaproteobacteria bacterium]|nr:Fic family protein [Candidatus Desulfobacula maris]MBL6994377.1 Fic family protein [Desulfobacula sp.]
MIRAGFVHIWFFTIHPFYDGNGRIAITLCEVRIPPSIEGHLPLQVKHCLGYFGFDRHFYNHLKIMSVSVLLFYSAFSNNG